jgi:hypothetical protein
MAPEGAVSTVFFKTIVSVGGIHSSAHCFDINLGVCGLGGRADIPYANSYGASRDVPINFGDKSDASSWGASRDASIFVGDTKSDASSWGASRDVVGPLHVAPNNATPSHAMLLHALHLQGSPQGPTTESRVNPFLLFSSIPFYPFRSLLPRSP